MTPHAHPAGSQLEPPRTTARPTASAVKDTGKITALLSSHAGRDSTLSDARHCLSWSGSTCPCPAAIVPPVCSRPRLLTVLRPATDSGACCPRLRRIDVGRLAPGLSTTPPPRRQPAAAAAAAAWRRGTAAGVGCRGLWRGGGRGGRVGGSGRRRRVIRPCRRWWRGERRAATAVGAACGGSSRGRRTRRPSGGRRRVLLAGVSSGRGTQRTARWRPLLATRRHAAGRHRRPRDGGRDEGVAGGERVLVLVQNAGRCAGGGPADVLAVANADAASSASAGTRLPQLSWTG